MPSKDMNKQYILVVAEEYDLTADAVILELRKSGHSPIRFDPGNSPIKAGFSLPLPFSGKDGLLQTENRLVKLSSIKSVFWRIRHNSFAFRESYSYASAFRDVETNIGLDLLWSSLSCSWVNSPDYISGFGNIATQQKVANACGFSVPKTLITNQIEPLLAFLRACGGRAIYSPLSRSAMSDGAAPLGGAEFVSQCPLSSRIVDEHDIIGHDSAIEAAPCHFQEFTDAETFVHVVIVSNQIFAVETDCNDAVLPSMWKECSSSQTNFRACLFNETDAQRCRSFANRLELKYCVINFAKSSFGALTFLSCDSCGCCLALHLQHPEFNLISKLTNLLIA
jgi:hypothetical protein